MGRFILRSRSIFAFSAVRFGPALLLPLLPLTACATMQQRVAHKEDSLSAAGFVSRPADTPARQAMLTRLPPNKFTQRTHDGVVHYVSADPTGCNCLYVGTQQAYGTYVRQMQRQKLADQQQLTAEEFSDPTWDWGGWGGSFGRGFGYAGGLGW